MKSCVWSVLTSPRKRKPVKPLLKVDISPLMCDMKTFTHRKKKLENGKCVTIVYPDDITDTYPDIKDTYPDITDTHPDITDTYPDIKDTYTDITGTYPDIKDTYPDITDTHPDITDTYPDIKDTYPDITDTHPDITDTYPDITDMYPDITDTYPDITDTYPDFSSGCKKWLQNIGRQDLLGKSLHQLRRKGYRVCSNHFHSDHLRHTTGKTLRLYPNAVPTLLTSGKRPPQKKGSDREESPAVSMPEVKVELDWAEDPTMYCYPDVYPEEADSDLKPRTSGDLQAASGHGGRSVALPGTADCDVDTSPNIEDCIKSECAEETCVSVNSESLDTSPQGVDFVKSEDIEEEEETMSANLAEVIKPEIVEEGEEECLSVSRENMKHSSQFHKGSREQTSPEQLERWGAVSMDVTSDGGCVDSREKLSGHDRQTTASDVLEEDDVDMTYTVVKAEPESDVEEQ
ncbi:hypothetical protein ACOMHN_003318 [Nucella lapillus]